MNPFKLMQMNQDEMCAAMEMMCGIFCVEN